MGVVLRGYDAHLEREVAIKLMLGVASADARRRQRFQIEARALAKLARKLHEERRFAALFMQFSGV